MSVPSRHNVPKSSEGVATMDQEKPMNYGTVKWFNEKKGFGFITPEGGGEDLFVHFTNITAEGFRTLLDGQNVEFEAAEGKKGKEAIRVRPV